MTTPPEAEPPSTGVTETPPAGTGQGQEKSQRKSFGTILKESFLEGNTFTVTVLALFTATVLGGLLCAFTNTTVLNAPDGRGDDRAGVGRRLGYLRGAVRGIGIQPAHRRGAVPAGLAIHRDPRRVPVRVSSSPLSETAVQATPLILTGLAVALPYRAGLFNIGGQGQFIGGAILAAWLGYAVSLPFFVHVVVCVIGGFVGGAVIGWLTGEIKARTGAHEVIVTIMLNYVMLYLLAYLLSSQSLLQASGSPNPITPPIASNAHLPLLFGTNLRINAGFLIALACAFGVWWLLNRTTTGFEFRSVGANSSAARVAGMNVERSWVLVMLIGGGLAGLAGATVIQGTDFTLNPQSYGTYGIDAITVALLGLGRPGGVVLAGLLFGALHAGSPGMQTVDLHAGADRAGAAGADRPVRRRAAADPRDLPAPRRAGQRGRLGHVQGVERVTSSSAPAAPARLPVLLPPATGGASRVGRFAAPITYAVFGLVDILVFGLHAHGSATFAFSPQFAKVQVPNLVLPAAATCVRLGGVTLRWPWCACCPCWGGCRWGGRCSGSSSAWCCSRSSSRCSPGPTPGSRSRSTW